jgi:cytochrome c biogenesis protein CcdA
MKRYDATYSAAIFVVSFIMSATLMSAAHYHTFQDLNGLDDYIMYPMGLLILLVGASMLVRREKPVVHDRDERYLCTERLLLPNN